MDKSKITKSLAVFASLLLIIIIGVASFAYFGTFNVNLNNNVAVNINAVSPGDATFISNATQLNLQVPAANMSQTNAGNLAALNTAVLTLNLTGAANLLTTCTYDIVYEYDENSYVYGYGETPVTENKDNAPDIVLAIRNGTSLEDAEPTTNGVNYYSGRPFNYFEGSNPTGNYDENDKWDSIRKRVLVRNASISSYGEMVTQNWLILMGYLNLPVSQEQLAGKAFTGKIYVTNHSCSTSEIPAYITLLNKYGGKDSITELPNTAFENVTTASDKGMYKKADDLGTSYYYRGAVDNNWVRFGKDSSNKDIYWRIIRINGDGSIRMIYSGTTKPTSATSVVMTGTGTQIGTGTFNSSDNKAEHVGYQYIEGQQHGYGKCNGTSASCTVNVKTVYNSTIKQAIDKWYAGTTLETDIATKSLVSQDQIFCNDRSASSTQTATWTSTGADYYYGTYGRLVINKTPILTCPEESDKFTVNTSNGNGALTYPVGLITEDEVAMAGGKSGTGNSSYYLYTDQNYWLGSPSLFLSNGIARVFHVYLSGGLYTYNVSDVFGARPVVSLSSKAKLSGNGTYSKPYTVS